MKVKIKQLLLVSLFALLSFTACQDEVTEVISPSEQETIVPNSTLANLISNTSANFGAADNILDGSSCFSVELPVTIIVSDITIVIETEADLEQLEDLLDDLDDDDDLLDFIFPITIIFSDYTELVIENVDQLENFINECNDEDDDVIDCVDFVYPISFSVFNSDFNLIETVSIGDDEALYNFLDGLEDNENALIVSLNYPVTLEYADGETLEVNSNEELAQAIESAEDYCDDEENDCNEEDILATLLECPWDINDENDNYEIYQIIFNEDGSLAITEGETTSAIGGQWSLSSTDDGLKLTLSELTAFQDDLGGEWLIIECDDDELRIQRENYIIELEQDCEGDLGCSAIDISENIIECAWELETNLIESIVPIYVYFTSNGQVLVASSNATEFEIGTWELLLNGGDIFIELELGEGFETLSNQWQVVECEDGELYLVSSDNYISLDQECDLNESNCDDEDVEINLKECIWNVVNLNGSNDLIAFDFDFTENYNVYISQNNDVINEGSWSISESATGLLLNLELQFENLAGNWYIIECTDDRLELVRGDDVMVLERDCEVDANPFNCFDDYELVECANPSGESEFNLSANTIGLTDCPVNFTASFHVTIADAENNIEAISNTESYFSTSGQVYLRIEADNGDFEIFTIYLNTEDCNLFECFQSFDAVIAICDNGEDGPNEFDLTIAFANCTPSADVVTYHETQADADANINAIASPSLYATADVESTVYVRVEIENQFQVFFIQLLVEDCNQEECSEQDVDAFLSECIWNAVNYNGSDNLMDWNFDFESANQIVVIYTATQTIDATWSTSQSNDGMILEFSNVAGPNIQAITGEWLVVECEEGRLELHRNEDILVLERNCD